MRRSSQLASRSIAELLGEGSTGNTPRVPAEIALQLTSPADRGMGSAAGPSPHVHEGIAATPAEALFPLVYRHMRSLSGGRVQDLDDLVQSAMEQALRSLPSFEGRAALSTWVYRVCYLTLLKHRRWYSRWLKRFQLTHEGEVPDLPDDSPNGVDAAETAQRAARLRAALEQLSPKRRAVVVLHDMEGLGVNEIAEIVGAGVLTVRSRLRDGRRDLAARLIADPYFGDAACSGAATRFEENP